MAPLSARQHDILRALVEEYTRTAVPVASRILTRKYGFSMSPATMRNEFVALERAGFIRKPHTSGGRVPTDAGYRLYVQACLMDEGQVHPRDEQRLMTSIDHGGDQGEVFARCVAKTLAEISAEAALMTAALHSFYYTGVTHLVVQPEFASGDRLSTLSSALDRIDELVPTLFADATQSPTILIGDENPLSHDCSIVMSRYAHGDTEGLIAIVGPMRMRYSANIGLINRTVKLIEHHDRIKHNKRK